MHPRTPPPANRPRRRRVPIRPGQPVTLVTIGRTLPALVCPMCAALVAADGRAAHSAWHAASTR